MYTKVTRSLFEMSVVYRLRDFTYILHTVNIPKVIAVYAKHTLYNFEPSKIAIALLIEHGKNLYPANARISIK